MAEPDHGRHNPFDDASLRQDIASFRPRREGESKARLVDEQLEALAAASGFEYRGPGRPKTIKEPTKTLQFRLPESIVDAFHQAAYEKFGLKHGAKTALFLKLWRESHASKDETSGRI